MKVKVCGMRDPGNIAEVAHLNPDYMGFIFYEGSPRFAGGLDAQALDTLPQGTKRVGVFVNATEETVRATAEKFKLDYVQLHGAESPEMCASLRKDYGVIKAFGVATEGDLMCMAEYGGVCDLFVFDTKTPSHGGSGQRFDHSILRAYAGATPYLLSGGISVYDATMAQTMTDPRCIGFDINSRFETAPGLKDPELVKKFIETIKEKR